MDKKRHLERGSCQGWGCAALGSSLVLWEKPHPFLWEKPCPLRKAMSSVKREFLRIPRSQPGSLRRKRRQDVSFFPGWTPTQQPQEALVQLLKPHLWLLVFPQLAEGVDTPGIPSRTVLCQLCRSVLLPGVPEQGHCPWGRHQRVCARVLCQNTACGHSQITQAPIWDPSPCFPGCDCQPSVLPPRCPQKFGVSTNTHLSFCSSCRAWAATLQCLRCPRWNSSPALGLLRVWTLFSDFTVCAWECFGIRISQDLHVHPSFAFSILKGQENLVNSLGIKFLFLNSLLIFLRSRSVFETLLFFFSNAQNRRHACNPMQHYWDTFLPNALKIIFSPFKSIISPVRSEPCLLLVLCSSFLPSHLFPLGRRTSRHCQRLKNLKPKAPC